MKPKWKIELEKKNAQNHFSGKTNNNQFEWRLFIDTFCKNFYCKPKDVYEMNYIDCLEYLRMWNANKEK